MNYPEEEVVAGVAAADNLDGADVSAPAESDLRFEDHDLVRTER